MEKQAGSRSRLGALMEHPNPWIFRPVLILLLLALGPLEWICWGKDCFADVFAWIRDTLYGLKELFLDLWDNTTYCARLTATAARVGWTHPSKRDALIQDLAQKEADR